MAEEPEPASFADAEEPDDQSRENTEDLQLLRTARVAAAQLLSRLALRYEHAAEEALADEYVTAQPMMVQQHWAAENQRYAVRQAARLLQLSEHTVTTHISIALRARETLPEVWGTFLRGLIDLPRLRRVVAAASTLNDSAQLIEFDHLASLKAPTLVAGKLSNWLNQTIASLDQSALGALYHQATASRSVSVFHREDGMSELYALIPTIEALQIQKTLSAAARDHNYPIAHAVGTSSMGITSGVATQESLKSDSAHGDLAPCPAPDTLGPSSGLARTRRGGDSRTLAQREADLFTTWLRAGPHHGISAEGEARVPVIDAKVALLVPEATLSQEENLPGITADRRTALPAHQIRDYLKTAAIQGAQIDWYTATHTLTRPYPLNDDPLVPQDLLSVRYEGHDPPPRLRDTILFRDGYCQAPQCTVVGENCDIDHQVPWAPAPFDGGPTAADNLWLLCRRHHRQKSHGLLSPPDASPDPWTGYSFSSEEGETTEGGNEADHNIPF